jgi:hypothetical protein
MHALMVSTPVNPLFEPGARPPTLPLLASQTSLFYEEELPLRARSTARNMPRPSHQLRPSTSRNTLSNLTLIAPPDCAATP